ALQYDPTRAQAPVKLGVFTSVDQSGGKAYIVLHTVTRQPSQLLTQAEITSMGQKIRPSIQVDQKKNLPDAGTVLWGTQGHCWRENVTYRASWNGQWLPVTPFVVPLLPVPGWALSAEGGGVLVTPTQGGFHCTLSGRLVNQRDSFWTDGWSPVGQPIPEKWRPQSSIIRFAVNSTDTGDNAIRVRLSSAGLHLAGFQKSDRNHIQKNFPTFLEFSWFIPMDPINAS
ncbi:hypothetical protein ODZ83_10920, partial [Acaricomes phytoseiuli]|uniref:hypothetical protein n=1 Tax=Acaricomes phytoseiuli TaxID=291968 RepID=UPI0022223B1C